MSLKEEIRDKASSIKKRVVFPEAEIDVRVLKAAAIMSGMGLAEPILLGNEEVISTLADKHEVDLPDSVVIKPYKNSDFDDEKFEYFKKKLAHKNPTDEQLRDISLNSLFTGGWMLDTGKADAAVAGSVASTGQVIVSALRTVGVAKGSQLVSSTFLMEMPDGNVFTYADCAVVPYPDSDQLASIALDAGDTHRLLTGEEPRIAFLSFSTKGSAQHEKVELVQKAYQRAKRNKPDWKMDGELQFDTAFVPSVAQRKAPNSEVGGEANVYIFPNLDAGNIAYKITERLAGATATGPILQGLSKPFMDLSRGCSVDDIVNTACVASLISQKVG
ncbi:phosphate acetyltransferase [Rhodohalobacter sp.]|uniref:phosphate acetyltransferase n=1 Tax=Rhodohalobacter sp. TaxID=1974210 RepID=UPI0035655922